MNTDRRHRLAQMIGYIVIIVMLILTSIFSMNMFFKEKTAQDKIDITKFPYTIDGWKGEDLIIEEYAYKILETRNLISRKYTNSSNESIYLFIIWSETNRSVFHPPEVCLLGSDIKIIDKATEPMEIGKNHFLVNKLYVEKNNFKDIVLYCYKAENLYTQNYTLQQIHFALKQLFRSNVKGATIRVSMPITKKGEKYTLSALKTFLIKTIEVVSAEGGPASGGDSL